MTQSSSSTGLLAAILREATDDELLRALRNRDVPTSGIRDFFDLAEELLSAESLQATLTRLDRRCLAALAHASTIPSSTADLQTAYGVETADLRHLRDLLLVRDTPEGATTWPAVGTLLATWPELGLDDPLSAAPEPGGEPRDRAHRDTTDNGNAETEAEQLALDALASEHAFTATSAIAELLFELEREPLKLLATGAVGRPGTRFLAELLRVDSAQVASYLNIAEHAGLTTRSGGKLLPSDSHEGWLEGSPATRWAHLADSWADTHWPNIRARISRPSVFRSGIHEWMKWNYPGGREWLNEHLAQRLKEAAILGIATSTSISTFGTHLLNREIVAATDLLAAALPTPISALYLQDDLTAVAPGPLETHRDARLRTMADVDGHTIASRYRFTGASITRALSRNETASTILEFLESISLSGIPQPLEYLVTETAMRHGLLRLGSLTPGEPTSRSYIRSDDAVLLRTVLIDRNLAALRLRATGDDRVISGCDLDQLHAMLVNAKYPVVVEDRHGRIVETQRGAAHRSAAPAALAPPALTPHQKLIRTLRTADADAPDDSAEAWLARQLESAIRTKSTVTVSVRMPNGKVLDYRLEPTAISGGRLRARDALSEIERTLPLSNVVAVLDN